MDFNEQLKQIQQIKTFQECIKDYDFMIDYEHIHIENCINTGYKHKRVSAFTDDEIIILAMELHKKIEEVI